MLSTQPKLSHKQKVLNVIKNNPGITPRSLASITTHKFNSRISELRQDGYVIEARRKKVPGQGVVYGYHLIEDRENVDEY